MERSVVGTYLYLLCYTANIIVGTSNKQIPIIWMLERSHKGHNTIDIWYRCTTTQTHLSKSLFLLFTLCFLIAEQPPGAGALRRCNGFLVWRMKHLAS